MVGVMDVYKSVNISIGAVMKNPETLKFIPDHLETKNMWRHAVKKLSYLLSHVFLYFIVFLINIKVVCINRGAGPKTSK